MPSFNVTIRRLVAQEAKIVVTVPEGEAPLSNLPDFDNPNITWTRTKVSELSHDCSPIIEQTEPLAVYEPDEPEEETPDVLPTP